jgi:hypothetical protein
MANKFPERQRKTTPTTDVPAGNPAHSFAGTNLDIDDKAAEREILARAERDFSRLFGAG